MDAGSIAGCRGSLETAQAAQTASKNGQAAAERELTYARIAPDEERRAVVRSETNVARLLTDFEAPITAIAKLVATRPGLSKRLGS